MLFIYITRLASNEIFSGVLISPSPDQEGNKLQRQKILIFLYPIYYHNWRNIITIFIYITRLASNEIFSQSNKIHREVGRAKDLSAPPYILSNVVAAFISLFCFLTYMSAPSDDIVNMKNLQTLKMRP